MTRRQLVLGKLDANEQPKKTLGLLGLHDYQGLSVCLGDTKHSILAQTGAATKIWQG
jgi:hypothetical protein